MTKKANVGGRPIGRTKTAKIEVVIEPDIKDAFMKKLKSEGKNASPEIGLWIRDYLKNSEEK